MELNLSMALDPEGVLSKVVAFEHKGTQGEVQDLEPREGQSVLPITDWNHSVRSTLVTIGPCQGSLATVIPLAYRFGEVKQRIISIHSVTHPLFQPT